MATLLLLTVLYYADAKEIRIARPFIPVLSAVIENKDILTAIIGEKASEEFVGMRPGLDQKGGYLEYEKAVIYRLKTPLGIKNACCKETYRLYENEVIINIVLNETNKTIQAYELTVDIIRQNEDTLVKYNAVIKQNNVSERVLQFICRGAMIRIARLLVEITDQGQEELR